MTDFLFIRTLSLLMASRLFSDNVKPKYPEKYFVLIIITIYIITTQRQTIQRSDSSFPNRIVGVIGNVLASSAVDREFESLLLLISAAC